MPSPKFTVVHVGNMNNKGTQALLKTDVAIIKEIFQGSRVSVLTADVEGVKNMNLAIENTMPSTIDIPYEKADSYARKLGIHRESWKYKAFAIQSLLMMPIQMASSCFSAALVKIGLKGFYRSAVLRTLKNSDAIISCSDENFKEAPAFLPLNIYWTLAWWSMLISRTWDILIARFLGKPVLMFPNSVGPFRTLLGRLVSKSALKSFDFILIREPISYKITESLHISTPKALTFDTTWMFKPDERASVKGHFCHCIGVSLGVYAQTFSREAIQKQTAFYAKALDDVVEQLGLSVVFLPHYVSGFSFDDAEISQMVIQKMRNRRYASIVQVQTADEFKLLLDEMDIVVSAKMHPAVLALSGTVPTLCIAYDHKQTGLFNSLEMSECVIPIGEFSGENLKSKILYVWNNREQIRARLRSRVPLIQKNVKDAIIHTLSACPDLIMSNAR